MRFNNLDLNLLIALDHLVSTKSISLAAERMNLSQSAMSNALGRLRQYFDDPLLVRVGQRMELTVRAEMMHPEIVDVLNHIEATLARRPVFDPKTTNRTFKVLVSDYSLQTIIPQAMALASPYSETIRFALMRQTDKPNILLERGEADFLIAPQIVCSVEHPSIELFRDDYCCVAWTGGRFGQEPLTREAFSAAGHVRYLSSSTQGAYDSVLLEDMGVDRRIEVTTYVFSTVPDLLVGTDRIAVVHRQTANLAARHLPITIHDLPFSIGGFQQMLQWHQYRSRDPGIAWMRDLFKEAARHLTKSTHA